MCLITPPPHPHPHTHTHTTFVLKLCFALATWRAVAKFCRPPCHQGAVIAVVKDVDAAVNRLGLLRAIFTFGFFSAGVNSATASKDPAVIWTLVRREILLHPWKGPSSLITTSKLQPLLCSAHGIMPLDLRRDRDAPFTLLSISDGELLRQMQINADSAHAHAATHAFSIWIARIHSQSDSLCVSVLRCCVSVLRWSQ